MLPVAVLAWLGVDERRQGQGLGGLLLAQALCDCYEYRLFISAKRLRAMMEVG